jgi:hypothetical protein
MKRAIQTRYGRAKRLSDAEARERLRQLLKHHSAVLDGRAQPLSKFEMHEFAKLAYKYKYDPEFADHMMVRYANKPGPAPKHEDVPVMTNRVRIPGMLP